MPDVTLYDVDAFLGVFDVALDTFDIIIPPNLRAALRV
jgi:hypothetical protein